MKHDRVVAVEVPNFGFGPACALLDVAEAFLGDFSWRILSVGDTAEFLADQIPDAQIESFDGFDQAEWPRLSGLLAKRIPLVSISNPPFAAWAACAGWRVGLIDQLDWMWESNPDGIENLEFHLAQSYFGKSTKRNRSSSVVSVRPIVNSAFRTSRAPHVTRSGAVIAFGGMAIAGRVGASDDYARWFLDIALPLLADEWAVAPIIVVGGRTNLAELAALRWRGDPRVSFRTAVRRREYVDLVVSAHHLLLTPGLATMYECSTARLTPLLQPGFNKSMVLQLRDLELTRYPWTAEWPWASEVATAIANVPQVEALRIVGERISDSLRGDDGSAAQVSEAISQYLGREADQSLGLAIGSELPDASPMVRAELQLLVT